MILVLHSGTMWILFFVFALEFSLEESNILSWLSHPLEFLLWAADTKGKKLARLVDEEISNKQSHWKECVCPWECKSKCCQIVLVTNTGFIRIIVQWNFIHQLKNHNHLVQRIKLINIRHFMGDCLAFIWLTIWQTRTFLSGNWVFAFCPTILSRMYEVVSIFVCLFSVPEGKFSRGREIQK